MKSAFPLQMLEEGSGAVWEAGERTLQSFIVAESEAAQHRLFLEAGDFPYGAKIADMGSGFGTWALEVAKLRPDLTVVSVNICRAQLAYCPEPKLEESFEKTSFKAGELGGALFAFSFGHGEAHPIWRELQRICAVGASVVIFDMDGPEKHLWPLAYDIFGPSEGLAEQFGFKLRRRQLFYGVAPKSSKIASPEVLDLWYAPMTPGLWVYTKL